MEKKIKALYILSIAAILAFLGMQGYWLYSRYEFSLKEYEYSAESLISDIIVEYNKDRTSRANTRFQTSYNMRNVVDSLGQQKRKISVTTTTIQGRELLGIHEKRKLTDQEMEKLTNIVLDSLELIDAKRAALDVSSAPSDGAAWAAMKNFELEVQAPFSAESLDSLLTKEGLDTDVSLVETDSLIWTPMTLQHSSASHPGFKYISPYSELERKAVAIECKIPTSSIIKDMSRTLGIAFILSVLLILCLVWQIQTIVRLSRLDKMRNSFITTMIHELKRPISTLKMCVSGLENEKMLENKEIKTELTHATRSALDKLSAYFSKLRDITFNNIEQIPLNITRFHLHSLVEDLISTVAIPGGKEVHIKNDVDVRLEVSADKSHLFNIVNNLFENAIKYSGDSLGISVATSISEDGISIIVSDTGNGIAPSELKKIFTRFYRGKSTEAGIPGMGLGLTYVKLLTEAHGGSVSVTSQAGAGSTFTISLPQ